LVRWLRAQVGWVILAFLVAWPPIHMWLARQYRFSTWRYGGWGMYATPEASNREVHVFLSSCAWKGSKAELLTTTGEKRNGFFLYLVHGTRIDLVSFPDLDADEQRALARRVKDVRSLARPGDFEHLAQWIDARFPPALPGSLGIMVAEPHVDIQASRTYADAFGFVRERGRWSPVAPLRGPAALSAMIARLGACP
jgi:hypothetical protein